MLYHTFSQLLYGCRLSFYIKIKKKIGFSDRMIPLPQALMKLKPTQDARQEKQISVSLLNKFTYCAYRHSRLTQQLLSRRSGTSRNFAKSRIDYSLYVVNYVRILGGLLLKSTIKHSGTRSIATWQTRRLCYCPAVFFQSPPHCT